jgi:hypothetical protein
MGGRARPSILVNTMYKHRIASLTCQTGSRTLYKQMAAKDATIYIRADDAEKQAFTRAAALAGMSLSAWMRFELRRAAAEALAKVGERADFLPSTREAEVRE